MEIFPMFGRHTMPEYNYLSDEVFTVSDFFTHQECDSHIAFSESIGFDEAPINTALGPVIRKDVRNNTRVIHDDQRYADDLWSRIPDYVPHKIGDWNVCGVNERLRYYRYEIGQLFDWHFDGYFQRVSGERSHLTFMVYLNDDFEGGETTIERLTVKPEKGMALFFIHHLRHRGEPVISGRKYVLRTDVMYRKGGV